MHGFVHLCDNWSDTTGLTFLFASQLDRCNNPFFTPSKQLFSEFLIKDGLYNYEVEAHIFDGVVAIALAMNAEDEDAEEQAPGQELLKKLKNVSFDGASGPVALDERGDREPATIRFALESFGDPNSAEPLTLVYEVFTNAPSTTSTFEMAATRKAEVQWIGGSKQQPKDAIRQKVRGPSLHYPLMGD